MELAVREQCEDDTGGNSSCHVTCAMALAFGVWMERGGCRGRRKRRRGERKAGTSIGVVADGERAIRNVLHLRLSLSAYSYTSVISNSTL